MGGQSLDGRQDIMITSFEMKTPVQAFDSIYAMIRPNWHLDRENPVYESRGRPVGRQGLIFSMWFDCRWAGFSRMAAIRERGRAAGSYLAGRV